MRTLLTLSIILLFFGPGHAQWTSTQMGTGIYYNSGNVGIGTHLPPTTHKLYVDGNTWANGHLRVEGNFKTDIIYPLNSSQLLFNSGNGGKDVGFTQGNMGGNNTMEITTADYSNNQATRVMITGSNDAADIKFYRGPKGSEQLTLYVEGDNGHVGIGTTNIAGYLLSVAGKIRAEEVKVYTNWADYVFQPDYELPKLHQVEKYIAAHKHLPDFPAEKEVIENEGIEIGKIITLQQEKIEELFLYVIELEKRIEAIQYSE